LEEEVGLVGGHEEVIALIEKGYMVEGIRRELTGENARKETGYLIYTFQLFLIRKF